MGSHWFLLVLVILLTLLSAFFSASETTFSTVNRIRLKQDAQQGDSRAVRAIEVAENFDRALSAILIGNNVVNIASASIATIIATDLLGPPGAAVSTIVMTLLVLIFGEILPKSFAKENSERLALSFAGPVRALMRLLGPLVSLFSGIQRLVRRSSGGDAPTVTEQELKYIVETIQGEGVLEEQEGDLVQSALEFDETTVQQVLTPRVDVVGVEAGEEPSRVAELLLSQRYSRLPVYEGTIDRIVGILPAWDFLQARLQGQPADLRALSLPPYFVHKTMRISALLGEFKRRRIQMAVVTDDYGGTVGIVTMEDLLEELVGEIWDEDDEVVQELIKTGEHSYEVSGDMSAGALLGRFGISLEGLRPGHITMGGWAYERLGHIPEVGERFDYENLTVCVAGLEEQRITRLELTVHPRAGGKA